MEQSNVKEFELLKKLEQENKDCITEYMKTYFQVVIGIVGAIVALINFYAPGRKDWPASADDLFFQLLGYGLFAVCLMCQSFSLIILHKCHTHNKLSAYLRVLSREKWEKHPEEPPNSFFLWDVVQSKLGKKEKEISFRPFSLQQWKDRISRISWGLVTSLSVPVKKWHIRDSWSYPVSLSFGLHLSLLGAILTWIVYIQPHLREPPAQVFLSDSYACIVLGLQSMCRMPANIDGEKSGAFWAQSFLCVYLVLALFGNTNRIALLCRHHSSRTVGYYVSFFADQRAIFLKAIHKIVVANWNENWDTPDKTPEHAHPDPKSPEANGTPTEPPAQERPAGVES